MSDTVFTRAEYVNTPREEQAAAHRRYYGQFVNDATIAHVVRVIGRDRLLASRDPHFNDIPLCLWDSTAWGLPLAMPMGRAGDYYTPGGGVCIAKEAARQYVERHALAEDRDAYLAFARAQPDAFDVYSDLGWTMGEHDDLDTEPETRDEFIARASEQDADSEPDSWAFGPQYRAHIGATHPKE